MTVRRIRPSLASLPLALVLVLVLARVAFGQEVTPSPSPEPDPSTGVVAYLSQADRDRLDAVILGVAVLVFMGTAVVLVAGFRRG